MQFLFVDSNLFLQCRPVQELDWDRLVGREELTLLVPSAVLVELDKHKSDGNSRRAQRARRAIQFLDALLEASDDTVVVRTTPAKVIAQFAPEVSGDTSRSNDDSILFEVSELTRIHGNQAVGLVTHDTNLKVKAKRKGLRFFPVPDEWLLAPEPDEREKRVKQLEEEVARLKKQAPIIEIKLDGDEEIELVVPCYEPLSADMIESLMETMTKRFPMKRDFSLTPSERFLSMSAIDLSRLHAPADWEIAKYQNEEYPDWKKRLHNRLEHFHSSLQIRDGTTGVRLLLANAGTVPAEHLQVAVSVSDGLVLSNRKHYDKLIRGLLTLPKAPTPPQPRKITLDSLRGVQGPADFIAPYLPQVPVKRRRDEFYLKTGEKIDSKWVWACENVRHGATPEEFSFNVGVSAQAQVSGGQMFVEVSAENLPRATTKKVRIKMTNAPADTPTAAKEWLGLNSD